RRRARAPARGAPVGPRPPPPAAAARRCRARRARRLVRGLHRGVRPLLRQPAAGAASGRLGSRSSRCRDRRLCLAPMATELKPVYLVTGSDRPKVDRALARLRSHFPPDAHERLSAAEASGEDAVAACNALGLFGGTGRLVEVAGVERWKAADAKEVTAYLSSPAPE